MAKLRDLAKVIRSKNAGPYYLTLDMLFPDRKTFERVRDAGVITSEHVAALYGQPVAAVSTYWHEPSFSIKVTMVRPVAAGDLEDTDIYGAQQHAPLLDIEVPL